MKTLKTWAARLLAYLLVWCLTIQPALADIVTISQTPLATSGGSSILANLLFTLDDSGSMDWDYLPDHVDDARQCMSEDNGDTDCQRGDPPYEAGGQNGSNGVAYDPNVNYQPALNPDGTPVLATIDVTSVPNDAFGAQSGSSTNITTGITERRYCNANDVCKRNGATADGSALVSGTDAAANAMSAGRFSYRTHASNASTQIFGLPEMMPLASFSRSGNTITATTIAAHGLATGNVIYVTGTGLGSFDLSAATVTVVNATQFQYTRTNSGT